MLLENLANYATVEKAAQAMAGNWRQWSCFVWFGSNDIPDSHNVMLGYLVNNEYTLRQMTNLEYVRQELASHWGDLREGAMVGNYGADFHGDKNLLTGLMIRVFKDGEITEAFRRLYSIAKRYRRDGETIIDQATFERVRQREMLGYVYGHLEYQCPEHDVPFTLELAQQVTDSLISDDVDYDYDDLDRAIETEMGWVEDEDEDEDQ